MSRPVLLDLFCGAGGASLGYNRAGFDIVGVDVKPQPNYPFTFIRGDAIEVLGHLSNTFDVIHASPPCQFYSKATHATGDRSWHIRTIPSVRDALIKAGKPYVIENVVSARFDLEDPILVCGTSLGLRVRRHRYFEVHPRISLNLLGCLHADDDFTFTHGNKNTESQYRAAMDCDWMTTRESREAIPPAYTEIIGSTIMSQVLAGVLV